MLSSTENVLESTVTIVVIAYNHERFIVKALDAAFAQSYKNCSVIVFDDASPDGTAECVRDYLRGERQSTTFVEHQINRGLCATLNEALAYVTSEYVVFISADDWMEPNRIEEQVRALDALGTGFGAAYSDANIVDASGLPVGETFINAYLGEAEPPEGDIFLDLLRKNWIPAPAVLIRTNVFATVGRYDEDLPYEDYDMWLRIARSFKIAYTPGNLVNYRNVPGSLTEVVFVVEAPKARLAMVRIYKKHLGISAEADRIVAGHLEHLVVSQYLQGSPAADVEADLRYMARKTRSPTIFAYSLLAQMRVPGTWIASTKVLLNKAKSRRSYRDPTA